jgi:hypothetical protein
MIKWAVPMECVRALASPTGSAAILRLELRSAAFRPHQNMILTENGFAAELTYEDPAYPGRDQFMAVALSAVPKENAVGPR